MRGIITIVVVIIAVINMFTPGIVPMSNAFDTELQYNILTITSILAGFSFSALALLVSISNHELVVKLRGTDLISKRSELVSQSIYGYLTAMLISIYLVSGINNTLIEGLKFMPDITYNIWHKLLVYVQIVVILYGTIYLIIATRKILTLINKINGVNSKKSDKVKNEIAKKEMK